MLEALDGVRRRIRAHAGDVEVVSVRRSGEVTLAFTGACVKCPAQAMTFGASILPAVETPARREQSLDAGAGRVGRRDAAHPDHVRKSGASRRCTNTDRQPPTGHFPRALSDSLLWTGGCLDVLYHDKIVHSHVCAYLVRGSAKTILIDTGNARTGRGSSGMSSSSWTAGRSTTSSPRMANCRIAGC